MSCLLQCSAKLHIACPHQLQGCMSLHLFSLERGNLGEDAWYWSRLPHVRPSLPEMVLFIEADRESASWASKNCSKTVASDLGDCCPSKMASGTCKQYQKLHTFFCSYVEASRCCTPERLELHWYAILSRAFSKGSLQIRLQALRLLWAIWGTWYMWLNKHIDLYI